MSCPYLTISHFTVPCDLGWDSKNTHHSVSTVHDSEKRDSVKSFRSAAKNLPVSTTIENPYSKTGLYGCFCQKELRWTEKYMYQVYFCTAVHLVRMVHVFWGQYHFYRNGLCRSSMPTNPLAYLPPPILTLFVYSMLYRLSFCLRKEQKLFWERLLKALSSHHSL